MDNNEITNIIHAGIAFVVYLFVMIVLYYALSTPVDAILSAISDAATGYSAGPMATHGPNFSWAVKLAFAIGISIPVTWFIMWVFSREPDVSRIRRY